MKLVPLFLLIVLQQQQLSAGSTIVAVPTLLSRDSTARHKPDGGKGVHFRSALLLSGGAGGGGGSGGASWWSTPETIYNPLDRSSGSSNSDLGSSHRRYDLRTLSDFASRDSRLGFIRRVYSIFTVQMMTTIAVTAAVMQNEHLRYWLYSNWQTVGTGAALGSASSALALAWSKRLRHTVPLNYILLAVYTLLQSVLVGTFSSLFDPRTVSLGTMHTLTAFLALTCWTFLNPQKDLTILGSSLLTLSCTASLAILLARFFAMPLMDNLGSMLMAIVLSVYVAHDTAMIVGGTHRKHQYGQKEFILAALSLYQDVIRLFMRILEILNRIEQRQKNRFSRPHH